jgi:hypothetical protein
MESGESVVTVTEQSFVADVVAAAERAELDEALGGARRAQDFGATKADADLSGARAAADRLARDPGIHARICPALRSASDDLGTIAKTIGTALFPLALTPSAVVPISTLALGALAVLIARAGISAFCPAAEKKKADD